MFAFIISIEYQMTVEARDVEGTGLLATVPLIIRILDVNDETPVFENAPFHFTLTSDMRNFSSRAFIKVCIMDEALLALHVEMSHLSGHTCSRIWHACRSSISTI